MGTNKKHNNKDKWDYDKNDPFGREKPGKKENEETGYGHRTKRRGSAKKGNGLEEFSEESAEWREKSNWNPDDFDREKKPMKMREKKIRNRSAFIRYC